MLGILNLYRVLVPLVLLGLYFLGSLGGSRGIPVDSPQLFFFAAIFYLCYGLLSVIFVRRRLATAQIQTIIQATIDIASLMLILHACGGIAGGLGLLLLVPVGGLAFLLPPRSALFLAAVATLAVLLHTIWQQITGHADITVYATAGLLGLVMFTIAGSASVLSSRMRESEDLVRQKEVDLANLAELSQYIVQHLRESLLVVDAADRIRLINESAAEILGDTYAVPGALVGEVSPRLLYSLSTWRRGMQAEERPSSFVAADGARVIQPHFAPLGASAPGPTLIFLEDTSLMAERVQQGKLAALGRLSASIAHEIRNPVGAMSHAGQLLAESPNLGPDDRRLTEIIRSNSERVSTIISNVLQLSRRESVKPTRLMLGDWLEDFLPEFSQTMQVSLEAVSVHEEPDDLEVRFDPSHLRQVVWNLCDNAIKYGEGRGDAKEARSGAQVEIRLSRLPSYRPCLEVADRGSGIEAGSADRIFEPFFTGGRKGGTGLGLFIARELCQLNHAVLLYEPRSGGGSIFRVVFSDPQRWEE
ncbi:MAG TPA: PAS domain-containing sensor histidine kinase [Steroidobacteraceae bacterium]|nr:PAS domain-containing sensor histidine kinase [Steroidobacteraceae bacterium]